VALVDLIADLENFKYEVSGPDKINAQISDGVDFFDDVKGGATGFTPKVDLESRYHKYVEGPVVAPRDHTGTYYANVNAIEGRGSIFMDDSGFYTVPIEEVNTTPPGTTSGIPLFDGIQTTHNIPQITLTGPFGDDDYQSTFDMVNGKMVSISPGAHGSTTTPLANYASQYGPDADSPFWPDYAAPWPTDIFHTHDGIEGSKLYDHYGSPFSVPFKHLSLDKSPFVVRQGYWHDFGSGWLPWKLFMNTSFTGWKLGSIHIGVNDAAEGAEPFWPTAAPHPQGANVNRYSQRSYPYPITDGADLHDWVGDATGDSFEAPFIRFRTDGHATDYTDMEGSKFYTSFGDTISISNYFNPPFSHMSLNISPFKSVGLIDEDGNVSAVDFESNWRQGSIHIPSDQTEAAASHPITLYHGEGHTIGVDKQRKVYQQHFLNSPFQNIPLSSSPFALVDLDGDGALEETAPQWKLGSIHIDIAGGDETRGPWDWSLVPAEKIIGKFSDANVGITGNYLSRIDLGLITTGQYITFPYGVTDLVPESIFDDLQDPGQLQVPPHFGGQLTIPTDAASVVGETDMTSLLGTTWGLSRYAAGGTQIAISTSQWNPHSDPNPAVGLGRIDVQLQAPTWTYDDATDIWSYDVDDLVSYGGSPNFDKSGHLLYFGSEGVFPDRLPYVIPYHDGTGFVSGKDSTFLTQLGPASSPLFGNTGWHPENKYIDMVPHPIATIFDKSQLESLFQNADIVWDSPTDVWLGNTATEGVAWSDTEDYTNTNSAGKQTLFFDGETLAGLHGVKGADSKYLPYMEGNRLGLLWSKGQYIDNDKLRYGGKDYDSVPSGLDGITGTFGTKSFREVADPEQFQTFRQPFILREMGNQWGLDNTDSGGLFGFFGAGMNMGDNLMGGFVRGAPTFTGLIDRNLTDKLRIGKFLVTGQGITFIAKQFALQFLNPTIESRLWNPLSVLGLVGAGDALQSIIDGSPLETMQVLKDGVGDLALSAALPIGHAERHLGHGRYTDVNPLTLLEEGDDGIGDKIAAIPLIGSRLLTALNEKISNFGGMSRTAAQVSKIEMGKILGSEISLPSGDFGSMVGGVDLGGARMFLVNPNKYVALFGGGLSPSHVDDKGNVSFGINKGMGAGSTANSDADRILDAGGPKSKDGLVRGGTFNKHSNKIGGGALIKRHSTLAYGNLDESSGYGKQLYSAAELSATIITAVHSAGVKKQRESGDKIIKAIGQQGQSHEPVWDAGIIDGLIKKDGAKYVTALTDKINMHPYGSENLADDNPDFIKFRFYDIVNNKYIIFRAILDGISDSISTDYGEEKFIGRPDKLYVYQGADRSVSFNFKVYPKTKQEFPVLLEKMNYLVGLCYPSYTKENERMITPFIKLTIGDMFKDAPGVMDSLTVTVEDSSTWEIEEGLQFPHFISVACQFKYIGRDILATTGKHYGLNHLPSGRVNRFGNDGLGFPNFPKRTLKYQELFGELNQADTQFTDTVVVGNGLGGGDSNE